MHAGVSLASTKHIRTEWMGMMIRSLFDEAHFLAFFSGAGDLDAIEKIGKKIMRLRAAEITPSKSSGQCFFSALL